MSRPEDLWLRHLSNTLGATRQTAYLWHVEEDRYEFLGDAAGVFGLAEDAALPAKKEDFARMVNPQDLVNRQLAIADAVAQCPAGDVTFVLQYRIHKNDGKFMHVSENGVAHFDHATKKTIVQSLIRHDARAADRIARMAARQQQRERISYVFSGSSSRQNLQNKIDDHLGLGILESSRGFFLAIGIDRLSLINEAYGSAIADEVIMKTGLRLESMVGKLATIARIGGDVFGVLFADTPQAEMGDISRNILNMFHHQPIEAGEAAVRTLVTIGGIKLDDRSLKSASIIARAEMALQEAKQQGRGCFICYTEKMHEQVRSFRTGLDIANGFLKGFKDGRVKLAYQPIMGARSNQVSFYECLIRLVDEDGTVQPAGNFIAAVEKMGLTRLVDTFCAQQAIKELKSYPDISLSVNVSNHTLIDPQWLSDVTNALRDHPDVARRLIVEITESAAMQDIEQSMRVLKTLTDMGCRIALDDFGVGQTAFSQLKDLNLDIVKIDKSFVRDMNREENMIFIRTLHSLAAAMNLETVGEGAETLAEADILKQGGIDHVQGFAYGMPSMERLWLPDSHPDRRVSPLSSIEKFYVA